VGAAAAEGGGNETWIRLGAGTLSRELRLRILALEMRDAGFKYHSTRLGVTTKWAQP
jgi:hypothetical protein